MFLNIRIYDNAREKVEVARRVREGFVEPLGSRLPGFRGWYSFDGGDGRFGSVTMFDNAEAAAAYNLAADDWVSANDLSDLLPEAPAIVIGKVIASVEA
ncbi:MAG: hypothetical protein QF582_16755 [Alphaproteobacteria bacterium]|jgi:hypothetical protein|nr:hypothetical protein [Alphaproteobacteria bacterium]